MNSHNEVVLYVFYDILCFFFFTFLMFPFHIGSLMFRLPNFLKIVEFLVINEYCLRRQKKSVTAARVEMESDQGFSLVLL